MTTRSFSGAIAVAWISLLLAGCGGSSGSGGSNAVLPASVTIVAPQTAEVGGIVHFGTDLPGPADTLSYQWDFGDATQSTSSQPDHVYASSGRYSVSLTLRDQSGHQLEATTSLAVGRFSAVRDLKCTGAASTGWCWQLPQPYGHLMHDVQFTDAQQGWIVGDGGTILHTLDGGATSTEQFLPDGPGLQRIRFVDAQHGWLLGTDGGSDGGRMWRTNDGGASWTPTTAVPVNNATELWVLSQQTLVVNSTIVNTTVTSTSAISDDGGNTWRLSALPIKFVESDGTLWSDQIFPSMQYLQSLDGGRSFNDVAAWGGSGPAMMGVADGGLAWVWLDWDAASSRFINRLLVRNGFGAAWAAVPLPTIPDGGRLVNLRVAPDGAWAVSNPPLADSGVKGYSLWHANVPCGDWTLVGLPDDVKSMLVFRYGFVDGRTIWLQTEPIGARPTYLSSDGGRSWIKDFGQPAGTADYVDLLLRDAGGGLLLSYQTRWYRSIDEGRTWRALPGSQPPNDRITGLWMLDEHRGVATTAQGLLLETDNGGHEWRARAGVLSSGPGALRFTPNGTGWLNDGGVLRHSLDGGRSWPVASVPAAMGYVTQLQFVDDLHGFVSVPTTCGGTSLNTSFCNYAFYVTTDGGSNWLPLGAEQRVGYADVVRFAFRTATRGVRTLGGGVQTTEDGGLTWLSAQVDTASGSIYARRIVYSDDNTIWALQNLGYVARSTNGGRSWATVTLPVLPSGPQGNADTLDIAFADPLHGWIVGSYGLVLSTADGGQTWLRQASGTQNELNTVFALDANTVWVGGNGSTILASASAGH